MNEDLIIVGGGAAGMLAAVGALKTGVRPLLLEKMPRLGSKILITGKGRCNLTNSAEDIEYFIENMPGNGSFLYSALYTLNNYQLLDLFKRLGLEVKFERGGRVFPASDDAGEVVRVLESYLKEKNADIRLKTRVTGLIIEENKITGVKTNRGTLPAAAVIITTGGASYPGTGSTGDGYQLAEEAGHTVITPRPSLVPLETVERWVEKVEELTLKNVNVKAYHNERLIAEKFGEMCFTSFGVSGPVILSLSRRIVELFQKENGVISIGINLKPALSAEKLDRRLKRDFEKYSRRQFKNGLSDLLPSSLIMPFIELTGIDPEKVINQVTKEERKKIAHIMQDLRLTVKKPRPLAEAIVTAGGVNVKEVDPSDMSSKIIKGLYFAGEVLDVDGYTGGYNLQAAFSTGYLAGMASAQSIKKMQKVRI